MYTLEGARGTRPFLCRGLVPARGSEQRQGGYQPPYQKGNTRSEKVRILKFPMLILAIQQFSAEILTYMAGNLMHKATLEYTENVEE